MDCILKERVAVDAAEPLGIPVFPVLHAAMQPSEAELRHARRMLEAAWAVDGAAVALDGSMTDRPIMLRAQAVLERNRSG